jgi:1-phosphofructokinase
VIVTLTLNPSLDRTIEVPGLVRGSVIRSSARLLHPGGKGVNVARALLANGVEARAVVPVGGAVGRELVELLTDEGVAMTAVEVGAATRSNLTLSEPDGTITKINMDGGPLAADEIAALADTVMKLAQPSGWVVLSGSLPLDADHGLYARLTTQFTASGVSVAIDTSGPALPAAVAAAPTLVKPNRDELAEAVGRDLRTVGDVVAAAQALRDTGTHTVLASLGPDGAVLVEPDGVFVGECPVVEPRSTVGAGDCLLAGFLAAGARGPAALATALCWAAAAVELPGSGIPSPADVARHRAHVTSDFARSRALT